MQWFAFHVECLVSIIVPIEGIATIITTATVAVEWVRLEWEAPEQVPANEFVQTQSGHATIPPSRLTHTSMPCIRVRPSSSSIHLGVAVCMACIKTLPNFITKQQQKRQKIKNDNNNYRHPEEMTAHKLSDNKTRTKDCVFSGKAEILGNMERVVENRKCHKNSFSQNPEENRNNKERQQI